MNKGLLNNIKKVYSKIDLNEIKFNIISRGEDWFNQVTLNPCFRKEDIDSSTITANLGFYILPNAIRSLFKSINYNITGKICEERNLLAPTILNYYTSAFHNLESILALKGIIYFIPTTIIDNKEMYVKFKQTVIRYCKNNKWKIESSKKGHTNRWLELSRIYTDESNTPVTFLNLFDYLFGASFNNNLIDRNNFYQIFSKKEKIYYNDNIEKFYKLIPETRHKSAYSSLGTDIGVIDALVNGEPISNEAIKEHAKIFGEFSNSLLGFCFDSVIEVIKVLDLKMESKKAINFTIYMDYFDEIKIEQLNGEMLRKYEIIKEGLEFRMD